MNTLQTAGAAMDSATTLRDIARELKNSGMRCNCDFDNWQPEQNTGHSRVCRIHKAAIEQKTYPSAAIQKETP